MENNFLLESLAACHNVETKLITYFTVNTAFVSYLHSLDNLTDSLKFPLLLNGTTYKQTLPILLEPFTFDSKLLTAPKTLKDFVHQFQHKKEIFALQDRCDEKNNNSKFPNKNFIIDNCSINSFMFVTTIISLVVLTIVMCILCKHMKLKTLATCLALQQIKEVGTVAKQEHVTIVQDIECTSSKVHHT